MTCVPTCYLMRIFRIFKHYTDGLWVYLTCAVKIIYYPHPNPSPLPEGEGADVRCS